MVRVGIIGLGFMGRMHYGAYQSVPDARIVAVCDADPRRASGDLTDGWSNVPGADVKRLPMTQIRGTTSWQDLIGWDDVDVIDVCLPTPQHLEVVTASIATGKHVLCEKPMARTLAEGRAIAQAAAKSSGFFMPAMCMRFWSEWEWLKNAVADNRFGKVRSATFRRASNTPGGWFRDGKLSGGALLDLHVHDVDFVYHLFGKPQAVFSRGYSRDTGEIDHVVTQYLYDSPALVCAEGAWGMADGFGFRMQFTVNFERATAEYDFARQPPLHLFAAGKSEPVNTSTQTGYAGELRYFIDCVKNNTRPTRVTADDAVAGLAIIDAERRSVETKQPVAVGE
jgi:predicted dehydrogenase